MVMMVAGKGRSPGLVLRTSLEDVYFRSNFASLRDNLYITQPGPAATSLLLYCRGRWPIFLHPRRPTPAPPPPPLPSCPPTLPISTLHISPTFPPPSHSSPPTLLTHHPYPPVPPYPSVLHISPTFPPPPLLSSPLMTHPTPPYPSVLHIPPASPTPTILQLLPLPPS
ncbi:hypothetical protein Pcinc_025749 [Petrolisthes cinctipes]|uniref:Uncharacterized protein n=1 Tax=Petrolisthes cinctipes TaxID=88211 RepID=A0AAE1F877_PETCI|nr:hypothetical protein Pcinc_025749 [Petrolisthes cinctipes]